MDMKRKILILAALIITLLTAACGMNAEQIDSALTEIETNYQSGVYEQIPATLEKLDKAYNNMSDEQKSKFTELRPLMDNAVKNAPTIKDGLEKAQKNYDQKMYYEAQQELDKIKDYQLPPTEKTKFDELQDNVRTAIGTWKITEALQKIEATYNSGDYDLAFSNISELDITNATEEQKQKYNSLKSKINNSKLLVQAEGEYNKGNYNSALGTLSKIDTAYLDAEQNQKYGSLKEKIANAQAEAELKRQESSKITADRAKQLVKSRYGAATAMLNKEDDNYYYLVPYARYNEIIGTYEGPMGLCKVDKKNGQVIEVESASY